MLQTEGRFARTDKPADEFLPYVGHAIDPSGRACDDIALLSDGRVAVQLELEGRPMGLFDDERRYAARRQRHASVRALFGTDVALYESLVSHSKVPPFAVGSTRRAYPQELLKDYHDSITERVFARPWILTIVVAPPPLATLTNFMETLFGRTPKADARIIRKARELARTARKTLRDYRPRQRTTRWEGGCPYSEIGEGIAMVLYGRAMPVPRTRGLMCRAVYTSRVVCGLMGFEVHHPGRKSYGVTFGFEDYPELVPPHILDGITRVPCRLVMTNHYRFKSATIASKKYGDVSRQMDNVRDKASSVRVSNDAAQDEIESGRRISGDHQWTLAVHADTIEELEDAVAEVKSALATSSSLPVVQEGRGTFAAFWSQVPGAPPATDARHGLISGFNYCSFSPLLGTPRGTATPHWKRHLYRMVTEDHSHHDFSPHIRRVGHTLLIGPTGFGKSTDIGLAGVALLQCTDMVDGVVVILDKDRSNRLTVLNCHGNYADIRRGLEAGSGMAPLKAAADTEVWRSWLPQWITGLIMSDGKGGLAEDQITRIRMAVRFILRRPAELRTLAGLRQFLDHGQGSAGSRLERWCRGNALGWAFDGEADAIRLLPGLNAIDNSEILTADMLEVLSPAAAYQLFRIREVVGRGVRGAVIVDEAKSYLPSDASPFAEGFDAFSRELRKGNGMLWMAFHHPEDLDSKVGKALIANTPRKILYPNPSADEKAYRSLLACTQGEIDAVMGRMIDMGEGTKLIKDHSGSFIARTPLDRLPQHIAILSNDPNRSALWDRIAEELGTQDPDKIRPHYQRRYEEAAP